MEKSIHSKNRAKLCVICFKYQPQNLNKKDKKASCFPIQEDHEQLIKKSFIPNYSFEDQRFPTVLCQNCYNAVGDSKKNIFRRKVAVYKYDQLEEEMLTLDSHCNCFICLKINDSSKPRSILKLGRMKRKIDSSAFDLCSNCLAPLKEGHKCSGGTVKRLKLLAQEKHVEQQLASTLLNDLKKINCQKELTLKNVHGKPSTVFLGKQEKVPVLTSEKILQIQKRNTRSMKNTKCLISLLKETG